MTDNLKDIVIIFHALAKHLGERYDATIPFVCDVVTEAGLKPLAWNGECRRGAEGSTALKSFGRFLDANTAETVAGIVLIASVNVFIDDLGDIVQGLGCANKRIPGQTVSYQKYYRQFSNVGLESNPLIEKEILKSPNSPWPYAEKPVVHIDWRATKYLKESREDVFGRDGNEVPPATFINFMDREINARDALTHWAKSLCHPSLGA